MPRHQRRAIAARNLKSLCKQSVNFIFKSTEAILTWLATDHYRFDKVMQHMPQTSFIDDIKYMFTYLVIVLFGIVLQAAWIFILIGYVLPFIIFGHF